MQLGGLERLVTINFIIIYPILAIQKLLDTEVLYYGSKL